MTMHSTENSPGPVVRAAPMRFSSATRRSASDWLFAALVAGACAWVLWRYGDYLDGYETAILLAAAPTLVALGWFWRPVQGFALAVGGLAVLAIRLYQGDGGADLARSEQQWLLKYLLSSQSAILWMGVLYLLSTVFYWLGLWRPALAAVGAALAWSASALALAGTLVRWYESYLIGPDVGYIPVSNLYEVFILFCWLTTLFYLYYEQHYRTRSLGAFVMPIVAAAVGFLAWYAVAREGHLIQPLVPALQSWWMKLHVPANFIGYGTFAIAAMVAFAWLIKYHAQHGRRWQLVPLWLLGVVLCLEPLLFRRNAADAAPSFWMLYFGVAALLVSTVVALRRPLAARLPDFDVLDDLMYKAIAVGFAFFTIATVLGAFWAAEAWGGYWSWDPKETWALIVWLNYATWLHMRLVKGLRGAWLAWWALLGLAVTSFAFLGVNLFLSGLHSYGQL